MLKKILIAGTLLSWMVLLAGVGGSSAQDSPPAKPASEAAEPAHAFRLDFVVTELEDGKKTNARQYSMNLNGGDQGEIKIGSRVPVEPKSGEFQYLDVGTNIWCRLRDRRDVSWLGNDLLMNVRSEISNFAMPDQAVQSSRPIVRQMKIDANTIVVIGKSMVMGIVDDPSSKRQFQLEVTVTKLR